MKKIIILFCLAITCLAQNAHAFYYDAKCLNPEGKLKKCFIDLKMIQEAVDGNVSGKEFFVCGPPAFMGAMINCLRGMGVGGDRIFTEKFSMVPSFGQSLEDKWFKYVFRGASAVFLAVLVMIFLNEKEKLEKLFEFCLLWNSLKDICESLFVFFSGYPQRLILRIFQIFQSTHEVWQVHFQHRRRRTLRFRTFGLLIGIKIKRFDAKSRKNWKNKDKNERSTFSFYFHIIIVNNSLRIICEQRKF